MKRRTLLATAALGLGLAFGGTAMAQDKTKACFVYVGPIGDGGWTYQHHQGALAVQCRDEAPSNALLAPINHSETHITVTAERAFLAG